MVLTNSGIWWKAPRSLKALLARTAIRNAFENYVTSELCWRVAEATDWPGDEVTGPFFHARADGFGWVTEHDTRRVFLVPRGFYERPEWSLADCNLLGKNWRHLGHFEPLSAHWSIPRITDGWHASAS
jgi:hypothetical protein